MCVGRPVRTHTTVRLRRYSHRCGFPPDSIQHCSVVSHHVTTYLGSNLEEALTSARRKHISKAADSTGPGARDSVP